MNSSFLTPLISYSPNETDNDSAEDEFWPLHVRVLLTILFSSLALIGVVGNILVITVVLKVRGMVTPTNCYLVSLAASDGIFLAASTVTELKYLHTTESASCFDWLHYFGCVFFSFIPYLAINTSSLSITAFTIERYFGICDPIRASYMCTVKRAKAIILGIWLFSVIYNSPWLYLVDLKLNHTEYICNFRLNRDHFAYKAMYMFDLATFYIIPLILYLIIYSKIGYTITRNGPKNKGSNMKKFSIGYNSDILVGRMSLTVALTALNCTEQLTTVTIAKNTTNLDVHETTSLPHSETSNGTATLQHRGTFSRRANRGMNQVVKMLGIVVVIFAICWLPYRAMVAYNSFATHKWAPDWYIYTSKTMIFINCAINPIVYNLMSGKFRSAFSRLLHANSKAIYERESQRSKTMKIVCRTLASDNCYKDRTTTEVTTLLS